MRSKLEQEIQNLKCELEAAMCAYDDMTIEIQVMSTQLEDKIRVHELFEEVDGGV